MCDGGFQLKFNFDLNCNVDGRVWGFGIYTCFVFGQIVLKEIDSLSDDHGTDESMIVLEELEKIDDDCDKHGIQFVKIDDKSAARDYGIEYIPAIVYFEKQVPNVYDGDLQDEDQILQWLVEQLEKDEIEDVTDEMLDKMVKEGKMLAVLFCE